MYSSWSFSSKRYAAHPIGVVAAGLSQVPSCRLLSPAPLGSGQIHVLESVWERGSSAITPSEHLTDLAVT
jgi:hypothetical protein